MRSATNSSISSMQLSALKAQQTLMFWHLSHSANMAQWDEAARWAKRRW
jgi:hypothetical protein